VVGEADSGPQASQLLKAHAADVDVVMLDISMEEGDGITATGYITQTYPHIHVLIFSMHTSATYVLTAVHAGAAGYVPKSATEGGLAQALRAVARGDSYLSPAVAKHVTQSYRRSQSPDSTGDTHAPPTETFLRAAERELLQMIATGKTTKDIAARFHISPKAAEARRMRLMERLDIHNIATLVRYAIRTGIVAVDE
jgi:DNA-binding NarL/FixJ family response regulator